MTGHAPINYVSFLILAIALLHGGCTNSAAIYQPRGDGGIVDGRIHDSRIHDSHIHDSHIHDSRIHDSRIHDSRIHDSRIHDSRQPQLDASHKKDAQQTSDGCSPVPCALHCIGGLATDAAGCKICKCQYQTMLSTVQDVSTAGFGTFGSHNQRVVATAHGIYLSFQLNEKGTDHNGDWKLVRSQDGGASWTEVYSAAGTRAPALVADRTGNVHLVSADANADKLHVYSFSGVSLTGHHAYDGIRCDAKFTALYDPNWNNIYIATQYGRFLAIWLKTYGIIHDYQVYQDAKNQSPVAVAQYPQLALDNKGNIHFATTTSTKSNTQVYRNILHVFASPQSNGQLAWMRMARPGESGAQVTVQGYEALEIMEKTKGPNGDTSAAKRLCKGWSRRFVLTNREAH
jgi:hypothetical protein